MTPEQTLTTAAQKLRAAATADYVQPGPWHIHEAYGFLRVDNDRDKSREAWTVKSGADLAEENRNTAEYIALMHPGVGLAVAALLAEEADSVSQDGGVVQNSTTEAALAIARAILGEQP
ncbi:hypothetical protein [Kitasatospora griseola]|uniref:hypothetical protein n=1 Tax=Kitasatospora griseola TaxID=2064 RepID=UPI00365CCCA5